MEVKYMNINKINIIKPRIIFLVFIYSIAFTLLLIGLKALNTETKAEAYGDKKSETTFEGESMQEIQKNIADNIIRLHVIANSDTKEDQLLKLKVRDGILEEIKDSVKNTSSVQEAQQSLISKKDTISNTARKIINDNGYNYDVNIALKDRYFPVKSYGDLVFPAGEYNALCVEIGEAKGRNWWCVLFPSLCLVDETKVVVPDESKAKLKESLTDSEYDILEQSDTINNECHDNDKPKIECHSAIFEWFDKFY